MAIALPDGQPRLLFPVTVIQISCVPNTYIYIYTDFYIICIGALGLLEEIDTIDCKFWGGVLAFVQKTSSPSEELGVADAS